MSSSSRPARTSTVVLGFRRTTATGSDPVVEACSTATESTTMRSPPPSPSGPASTASENPGDELGGEHERDDDADAETEKEESSKSLPEEHKEALNRMKQTAKAFEQAATFQDFAVSLETMGSTMRDVHELRLMLYLLMGENRRIVKRERRARRKTRNFQKELKREESTNDLVKLQQAIARVESSTTNETRREGATGAVVQQLVGELETAVQTRQAKALVAELKPELDRLQAQAVVNTFPLPKVENSKEKLLLQWKELEQANYLHRCSWRELSAHCVKHLHDGSALADAPSSSSSPSSASSSSSSATGKTSSRKEKKGKT
mmetsp:Transcript_13390/g.34144  ORF Transcript_13390/g.34144 Transcript_13390/m.34144 type:complete len:320 (-) Transcript_13390:76-1035(-)